MLFSFHNTRHATCLPRNHEIEVLKLVLEHGQLLEVLVSHFGVERLVAELPQKEVAKLLDLVPVRDLAEELGVTYDSLRYAMSSDRIPFPTVRLVRRAYYTREQADEIKKKWPK